MTTSKGAPHVLGHVINSSGEKRMAPALESHPFLVSAMPRVHGWESHIGIVAIPTGDDSVVLLQQSDTGMISRFDWRDRLGL